MNTIQIHYYKSPIGELILGSFEDKLCLTDFRYRKMRTTIDKRIQKGLDAEYVEKKSEVIKESIKQLDEYFNMQRKVFEIPLLMVGTEFQKSVWKALIEIPFGETASYLEQAKKIDNEKVVRAVASANGANAIGIIIPCHRIIGSDGSLVGYAGGLPAKKKLLDLEKNLFTIIK
jgi:methylated-DNA-[protein]-cysteine S-methyltransferase